ncbi:hypothetical protein GBF38_015755 [Nibea albiflora]|uniref:Uncharacterized protein n=1 Tax=Nibea albiflora TaxID=240163 RepID=A0ACB7ELG3_NIBAL|nr:hypothetical protein GBF38_015755 [Nibea albiflora]
MAMSQALSEEEFHRMQVRYERLRCSSRHTELNAVRQKNVVLERDFIKAQKVIFIFIIIIIIIINHH